MEYTSFASRNATRSSPDTVRSESKLMSVLSSIRACCSGESVMVSTVTKRSYPLGTPMPLRRGSKERMEGEGNRG